MTATPPTAREAAREAAEGLADCIVADIVDCRTAAEDAHRRRPTEAARLALARLDTLTELASSCRARAETEPPVKLDSLNAYRSAAAFALAELVAADTADTAAELRARAGRHPADPDARLADEAAREAADTAAGLAAHLVARWFTPGWPEAYFDRAPALFALSHTARRLWNGVPPCDTRRHPVRVDTVRPWRVRVAP
jgi:hypothetical protein